MKHKLTDYERRETVTTKLEHHLEELIRVNGPSGVLRAFEVACRAKYKVLSMAAYEKYKDRKSHFNSEPKRDERKARDISSAWLCIADTDYMARSFDERIKTAGQSYAERDAAERIKKIKQHREELARLVKPKKERS